MQLEMISLQILDFLPKPDAEHPHPERVEGVRIWFMYDDPEGRNWMGPHVDKLFIRRDSPLYNKALQLKPGSLFSCEYQYSGRFPRLVDLIF